MTFEEEIKLTLVCGIIILTFATGLCYWRWQQAQDRVHELEVFISNKGVSDVFSS